MIDGINGDDAIDPGAPPTCFGVPLPLPLPLPLPCCAFAAPPRTEDDPCIFDTDLRLLRFFFGIMTMTITIIIDYLSRIL